MSYRRKFDVASSRICAKHIFCYKIKVILIDNTILVDVQEHGFEARIGLVNVVSNTRDGDLGDTTSSRSIESP